MDTLRDLELLIESRYPKHHVAGLREWAQGRTVMAG
jgi:hypothetical protein